MKKVTMTVVRRLNRTSLAVVAGLLMSGFATAQDQPSQAPQSRHIGEPTKQVPKYIPGGFDLPNGWRITPAGKAIATIEDLVLNLVVSPDGRIVVASHSGYLPHGIDVFDTRTQTRSIRGGGWNLSIPANFNAVLRIGSAPSSRVANLGIRCAR